MFPIYCKYSLSTLINIFSILRDKLSLRITHPGTLSPCRQRIQDTPARHSKSSYTAPPTEWDSQRRDDLQMILLLQLVRRSLQKQINL